MHKDILRRLTANDRTLDIFAVFFLNKLDQLLSVRDIKATTSEETQENGCNRFTCFAEYEDKEVALYWSLDEAEADWVEAEFGLTFADNPMRKYVSTIYVIYSPHDDSWKLGLEHQPFESPSDLAAKVAFMAFDLDEEQEIIINEEQAWASIRALVAGYLSKRKRYRKSRR